MKIEIAKCWTSEKFMPTIKILKRVTHYTIQFQLLVNWIQLDKWFKFNLNEITFVHLINLKWNQNKISNYFALTWRTDWSSSKRKLKRKSNKTIYQLSPWHTTHTVLQTSATYSTCCLWIYTNLYYRIAVSHFNFRVQFVISMACVCIFNQHLIWKFVEKHFHVR